QSMPTTRRNEYGRASASPCRRYLNIELRNSAESARRRARIFFARRVVRRRAGARCLCLVEAGTAEGFRLGEFSFHAAAETIEMEEDFKHRVCLLGEHLA